MAKTAKVPFAGKEKRKTPSKLPVPAPNAAQQAASATRESDVPELSKLFPLATAAHRSVRFEKPAKAAKPKATVIVDGVQISGDPGPLPESLKVENRKPLDKTARKAVETAMTKARTTDDHQKELRDAQKAHKAEKAKAKRNAKKEKAEAVAKGATTAMPAQGKDALKLIKGGKPDAKPVPKGEATRLKALEAARKRNGVTTDDKKKPKTPRKGGGKGAEIVISMLKRKQGATRAELCEATGWAGVSVPGFVRRAGMKLIKEKRDGVTCYRV